MQQNAYIRAQHKIIAHIHALQCSGSHTYALHIGQAGRVQVCTGAVSTEGYFHGRLSDLRDGNNKSES
jgi:hypothetical protein